MWMGYNAGYKDGTVELLDWGKYDQGAWYWKADFVLNSTYRGEECEYYQTGFSSKNGKKFVLQDTHTANNDYEKIYIRELTSRIYIAINVY